MNKYYVYVYLDTRKPGLYNYNNFISKYEPIYVGKGTGRRINEHLSIAKNKSRKRDNVYLYNKINKMLSNNIYPIIIKLVDNISEDESLKIEMELIKLIGRKDLNLGPLCNKTDGGDGTRGLYVTEETKQKISNSLKGKIYTKERIDKVLATKKIKKELGLYDYKCSDETKLKIGDGNRGKITSEDTKHKMKIAWEKRKETGVSEETKEKMRLAWEKRRLVGVSDETKKKMSESQKRNKKIPYT